MIDEQREHRLHRDPATAIPEEACPAIVRGIVEAHDGRATVRNVPGGCRFEVVLPAAAS
ncbi:ATP-binding protein [Streptomyces cyaneus]|uniref:ATP-binding protein n=1 Tax=Streptomyces cyaneus TaxID=1904 RepID=UPI001C6602CD|nr:ATP-binding protein [Streptomyces cyaneus]